eukprot:7680515-Alexandrium_andersonii.AAC.1
MYVDACEQKSGCLIARARVHGLVGSSTRAEVIAGLRAHTAAVPVHTATDSKAFAKGHARALRLSCSA